MQLLHAGKHQFLSLELDPDILRSSADQAGFAAKVEPRERTVILELEAPGRETPLLLFDAADPANTGWFSRCQFYVDARTGAVLQTPFLLANRKDPLGRLHQRGAIVQIRTELPANFQLPGRMPVNEKTVYSVFFNFLRALQETGVGICGSGPIRPLAGRPTQSQPRV